MKYITAWAMVLGGLVLLFLPSCGIFNAKARANDDQGLIKEVDFCELQAYDGEIVRTELVYTGVEEYWSATSLQECPLDGKLDLDLSVYDDSWQHFLVRRKLARLYSRYHKKRAHMTVVGRLHLAGMDSLITSDSSFQWIDGFGHLGHNEAQITVKRAKIRLKNKN